MKILVLNGSPRPNGNTAGMVKTFQHAAEEHGHQVKVFTVCKMDIKGCLACEYCHGKGHGQCVQKDDMQQIYAALRDADVIVFASPVYFWDITGTMKTAIDRLYAPLMNKAAGDPKGTVLLMTSGGSTIEHMLDWYKNFEEWLKWKDLGTAMNDVEKARRIGESIR